MNRREFFIRSASARAAFQVSSGQSSSVFKAGFAERDITPDIGSEQPGGYGKSYHTKFHDPCKVRAAVFDDGRKRVALVGVDAEAIPRHLVLAARKEIRDRSGIAENAVLAGASHSHSSGPVAGVQPGEFDHASPLVRRLAYEHSTAADAGYVGRVRSEIVNAVVIANDARVEAVCGVGFGLEDKVAYNRRLRMRNGRTYSHPGLGNPDTVGYAGPIDPQVGVIGAWGRDGRLLGCVVNYACHATTNPGGISANWIYYLEKTIRGATEPNVPVVFLQGACGDITQVDNLSRYAYPAGERWAQFVGGRIGAEAVKTLLSITPGALPPVESGSTVLTIKRRPPNPARVKDSLDLVQKDPKEVGLTKWTFAKEIVLLDAMISREPAVDVEVQAVQVGPAIFLTNPAELFVEYGLELKKKSPFPFTFPVELANGNVGYVPTEEAFGPHGGGYETRLTSYSNLEITAGRQMVEAGLNLARHFTPGHAPEPPGPPPFKEPWSYGDVPPELS
jgi:neutral ceramidase